MKTKKTYLFIILIILSLAFSLAACGGEYSSDSALKGEADIGDSYKEDELLQNNGALGDDTVQDQSAKIIRTVTIRGETKEFDIATETLKGQVKDYGGYVESSEISGGKSYRNGNDGERVASYVIRIPAESLDAFLEKTKGTLNVVSSSESTEDVTLDYYDIEARLSTLKSKKAALEAMLEKAESLDDMLAIQENLYDVIADIEAYQSRLNTYDNKVNYSTVNLTVWEVLEYTETEIGFGERIVKAFKGGWSFFAEAAQGLAVALVYITPLLVIPVIGLAVYLIIRAVRKKKGNK